SRTHFSSWRSASSVFGGKSSNDSVRPAARSSAIRAMEANRTSSARARPGISSAGPAGDGPGPGAGPAVDGVPAAGEGGDELLGGQVDRRLGPAAVHPDDEAAGAEHPLHLGREQEGV